MKTKVAAYCRVSTSSQDQDLSFDSQQRFFREEIGNKDSFKDYELIHIYADRGLTATKFKREQFLQMLYDGGVDVSYPSKSKKKIHFEASMKREPKFNRILVTNLSRFARDILAIDPLRELKSKGVFIDFLDCNKSTENDGDMFYIELMMTFAANDSRDKSQKLKAGLSKTAKWGSLFAAHRLYGYDYFEGEKRLEINEGEAEVVRLIYHLYVNEGYGFRRIINHLESKLIFTRNGKPFSINAIKHIVSNEKYCGTLVRNKWDSGAVFNKHYAKVKPETEWEVHEDVVPTIISKELFESAKQLRFDKGTEQRGVYKGIGEFSGLIICNKCGAAYVRNSDRGKILFNCGTKKSKGVQACDAPNLYEDVLEWAIEHFIGNGIEETIRNFKESYFTDLNIIKGKLLEKIDNQKEQDASTLRSQIDELDAQRKRVLKLYSLGKFKDDELDDLTNEINSEYETLNSQLQEVIMSNEDIYKNLSDIDEIINNISNFKVRDEHSTREEIIDFLSKIKVIGAVHAESNENLLILQFEFKAFEKLYDFTDKYFDSNVKETYSSSSIVWNRTTQSPYYRD
ncbi:recombinase family protein [Paenibacillus sp. Root444D2]|uniref:recombinase family protein n=1 Tax=Paenibacillus sp. Root444D2 TaxID=1736538 RepID=UPI00070D3A41|nr:recombinase family protein [Paenibacillus sp. Root444D2]KQX69207.1 hypothetical protein ASD40_01535 [Paenibacillus sp. Root444D2]